MLDAETGRKNGSKGFDIWGVYKGDAVMNLLVFLSKTIVRCRDRSISRKLMCTLLFSLGMDLG